MAEVMEIMNAKPLKPLSTDPDCPELLTVASPVSLGDFDAQWHKTVVPGGECAAL